MGWARTIVVGDVHGCYDELVELVNDRLSFNTRFPDRLVFVGDLIDRGPKSADVVRCVRRLQNFHGPAQVVCLMGNHEEKRVRYERHVRRQKQDPSYKIPMRAREPIALSDADLEWMEKLPLWVELEDGYVACHAGALPGVPFREQDRDTYLMCQLIDAETHKRISGIHDYENPPRGMVFWSRRWDGPEHIIYGHTVRQLPDVCIAEQANCVGIDTGCCYGGQLTAAVHYRAGEVSLNDRLEFVSVAARATYWARLTAVEG